MILQMHVMHLLHAGGVMAACGRCAGGVMTPV